MSIKVMLSPRGDSCIDIRRWKPIDSNVAGFISWERLSKALRDAGETKPEETLEALVIDDGGIQLYVRRRL